MKFDVGLPPFGIQGADVFAKTAEEAGISGLFSVESSHEPFLPLVLAAEHTKRLELGTGVAIAFVRSPMVLAYTAWDLANFSNGRLILGLGTQVKGHNERRFSVPWDRPGPRLRELILALRAIWGCWQNGNPLDFRGEFYTFTLMTPFFNPGPIQHPNIPLYVAGVNPYICKLAGELCGGFHIHPLHTVSFLKELVLPEVQEGAKKAGRSIDEITLASSAFVAIGDTKEEVRSQLEFAKMQISFYASTKAYRRVLSHHGWQDVGDRLTRLAAEGNWDAMPAQLPGALVEMMVEQGTLEEVAHKVRSKYEGVLNRISFYTPSLPTQEPERWKSAAAILQS
jgi:probable F420-dependent oxidoreductase